MFFYNKIFIFVFTLLSAIATAIIAINIGNKYSFDIVFAFSFMLIGIIVYMLTSGKKVSTIFLYLMLVIGWAIILLDINLFVARSLCKALSCVAPVLLYIFFAQVSNLENTEIYKKLLTILWIISGVAIICHLTDIYILNFTLFPVIILAVIFCIVISKKQKNKQRSFFRKYQASLIIAILISLVPFILINTVFRGFLSPDLYFLTGASIYSSIALPIVVGYILIKRDEIKTYTLRPIFRNKLFLSILLSATAVFVSIYFYNLTLVQLSLIVFTCTIIIYIYNFSNSYFSKKQIDLLAETKKSYEKEKLEILQGVSYDEYLTAIKQFFTVSIQKIVRVDGILIIWQETDHTYILEQTGIFKEYEMEQLDMPHEIERLIIEGKERLVFPLMHDELALGYLVLGDKVEATAFTEDEIISLEEMAQHVFNILYTSEKAYNTQQQYIRLPNIKYDEYINYQYLAQIEKLRKELSLYLHDEVLQTVLALRNMTDALDTSSKDITELMLTSFDTLNSSIREKMFDIYPSTLEVLDLSQSINIMCEKMRDEIPPQSQLRIATEIDPRINVHKNLKYPIFRLIKELLHNGIKHSKATQITVSIQQHDDLLYIQVVDDGVGFDVSEKLEENFYSQHIGLLSVKQDVNSLKGELSIRSIKGEGTDILIKLPLNEEERKK